MSLAQIWYWIFLLFISIYTILDGFDLGVGFWTFFTGNGPEYKDRRTLIRTIAPFWDGNEVWLLASGVILFAAFPDVYATIFSGFYIPLSLVLFCLIFRAVSIELRSEIPSQLWQRLCDIGFTIGSLVPALAYGVVVGNVLGGIPLDASKNYTGDILLLFNPYSMIIGLLGFSMILTHGAVYLMLRTSGKLSDKARNWAKISWIIYLALFIVGSGSTIFFQPQLMVTYQENIILLAVPIAGFISILAIGYFWQKKDELKTFILSAVSIFLLILSAGIAQYPNLVRATDSLNNLTIEGTASTEAGLLILLIISIIGLFLVIPYTAWIYKVFGGKVDRNIPQTA